MQGWWGLRAVIKRMDGRWPTISAPHSTAKLPRAHGIEQSVNTDPQQEIALPGDLHSVCPDDLNDMVDDEAIRLSLFQFGDNLQSGIDRLIEEANEDGGHDNVSVVPARVPQPFSSPRSLDPRTAQS